ncbi:PadR family transcriptional regulator [Phaeacidiphilus oryzae]|uniref:PadR family transcriptional regulator n=1 Tax=Phaeacidiphilus oryzae TaxID=348818 RepID=UPI000AE53649|nr:helix-turn-helix transcriptional regulator [Phaeacidiphilus oryzae]
MTPATARVLNALLAQPGTPRYGMELMELTGLRSGSLYPILARLAGAGWLARQREDVDPSAAGRPVRSYYTLTPRGADAAPRALAAAAAVYWSPSDPSDPSDPTGPTGPKAPRSKDDGDGR